MIISLFCFKCSDSSQPDYCSSSGKKHLAILRKLDYRIITERLGLTAAPQLTPPFIINLHHDTRSDTKITKMSSTLISGGMKPLYLIQTPLKHHEEKVFALTLLSIAKWIIKMIWWSLDCALECPLLH